MSTASPAAQAQFAPTSRTAAPGIKARNVAFLISNLMFIFQGLVGYVGVLLGWLPQNPTDDISFALVVLAYHGCFFAFWDAPGETRTTEDRFRLYINWWLITAASAVLFWELPWYYLEDNLLRLDRPLDSFHEDLRPLWIFWGYGIADNRFLNGDVTVLSIEAMSIHTGLVLVPTYFYMQRGKVWAFWVGALGMAGVAYTTVVYVIADWYIDWVHISDHWYDFWVKFILTQTPYVFYGGFASVCCLYVANQLAIRRHLELEERAL